MNNAFRLTTLAAVALIALAVGRALATEGVSPGAVDRMAQVNNACPTFSWGMDSGAIAYDLIAYNLPEEAAQQAELTADNEVLFARVAGSATSWTPSADQCLAPGGRYVWFVRAVNELAGDEVVAATEWSAGRYFTVPAAPSAEEMQRALEVLRRWDAANASGMSITSSGTGTGTVSEAHAGTGHRKGVGVGVGEGEGHPKSVPTASAAIRGEHPDTTGEKYGVVGMSSSYEGAGIAAANLDGGADLVLDGSVDGEVDTILYEWGMYRTSAVNESFSFRNPGAGRLDVTVDGDMTSDVVRTEEVVVNGMTVIDDGHDWLGNGSTVPCPGCVTSSDIANLSITGADLADGSVTGAKIALGAVDTSQIRGGAVENAQLADGAVTSTKLGDRAVSNAKLGNNAVTTDKIADGTIATADLADNAVTTAKIASGAVSSTDLAAGAVIGTKLADDAVAARHLEAGAVDSAAILDGAIMNADIGAGQVSTSHYANWSVTTDKLNLGAVTTSKIADGTITAEDVDPFGGVYASKSSVYVVTETTTIPAWLCNNATPDCYDANDLPLQGVWDVSSGATFFKKVREEVVSWSSNATAAGYLVELCDTSGVDFDLTASITCVSVPGP